MFFNLLLIHITSLISAVMLTLFIMTPHCVVISLVIYQIYIMALYHAGDKINDNDEAIYTIEAFTSFAASVADEQTVCFFSHDLCRVFNMINN